MLRNLVQNIRKYPKTTVFLTAASILIGNHVTTKYRTNLLRRRICTQLKVLGMERLPSEEKLLRVTVFLNPFAHQRRILEKFDENAMPLLQISGLDVQMVYLDDDDEAKTYSNVLDPTSTDAIIVAGDDNLLAKTVTGLLRRSDYVTTNLWNIPVYALPLGVFNNFCRIFGKDSVLVNWCYHMIEPVLQRSSKRRNVLKVKLVSETPIQAEHTSTNQQKDFPTREVFAMTGIEWGCWRDVEYGGGGLSLTAARPASHKARLADADDASYYYSPRQWAKRVGAVFRHAWCYIRSPVFDPSPPTVEQLERSNKKHKPLRRGCAKQATLVVKPACPGCKKCWSEKYSLAVSKIPPRPSQSLWFGRLLGSPSYSGSKRPNGNARSGHEQIVDKENPECGLETRLDVPRASRIVISLDGDYIRVSVSPPANGVVSYVKQALANLTSPAYHCAVKEEHVSQPLEAAASRLPQQQQAMVVGESDEFTLLCSSVTLYPGRCDGEFFWIDNDCFEARPVEVSVLKDAVNSFPLRQTVANEAAVYS
uniref:DAGKc domain-containing protein n=2 Tax=Mesocestoides corti TaxID=53468 RepID=A0A5K3FAG4_MESCO